MRSCNLSTLNRKGLKMKKSFTLIELLVVIAIIAILASMLLPALTKARAAGYRIQCINNLKQQGTFFLCYVHDHNDQMPYGFVCGAGIPGTKHIEDFWPQPNPWHAALALDYNGGNFNIFVCPTMAILGGIYSPQWGGWWNKSKLNYLYNCGNGGNAINRYKQPTKTYLVSELFADYLRLETCTVWGASSIHSAGGKANMLFADGHADLITPARYPLSSDDYIAGIE